MLVNLRREYVAAITSGSQLLLLVWAFQARSAAVWAGVTAAIGAISLAAWISARRRLRALADTPTSRIASAAQGYVELRGTGRALDGLQVLSPLTGLPCLWYRYRLERRDSENRWKTVSVEESDGSFLIDDGSARCLVDIDGAEILTIHHDTRLRERERDTVWTLLIGDTVHALGDFRTLGAQDPDLDLKRDVSDLLAEWKRDRVALLKRFDLDRDGTISLREWELARQAALREVRATHREVRAGADLHTLRKPVDGRLFLLSNLDPDRLLRRYRLWSFAHLTFFFVALAALAWMWRLRA